MNSNTDSVTIDSKCWERLSQQLSIVTIAIICMIVNKSSGDSIFKVKKFIGDKLGSSEYE